MRKDITTQITAGIADLEIRFGALLDTYRTEVRELLSKALSDHHKDIAALLEAHTESVKAAMANLPAPVVNNHIYPLPDTAPGTPEAEAAAGEPKPAGRPRARKTPGGTDAPLGA